MGFKIGQLVIIDEDNINMCEFKTGDICTVVSIDTSSYPDYSKDTNIYHLHKTGTLREIGLYGYRLKAYIADNISHPSHYTQGKIEVINFIIDKQLDFCEGNVVKYVCRAKHKEKQLEDYKKARQYLDFLIRDLEAQ